MLGLPGWALLIAYPGLAGRIEGHGKLRESHGEEEEPLVPEWLKSLTVNCPEFQNS